MNVKDMPVVGPVRTYQRRRRDQRLNVARNPSRPAHSWHRRIEPELDEGGSAHWPGSCDDRAVGAVGGSAACAGRAAYIGASRLVARRGLFGRLDASARVTVVSAPPGSGKTDLLQSWIGEAGLAQRTAWVSVVPDQRDPQRFWLAVAHALRQTGPGSALVRPLTAAPALDGGAIVERLLKDVASLRERIWLVIDDVHELGPSEVLRQLELLLMRAPADLHFVLTSRPEVRLGLHRLRLEGELTEIREPDLRFTLAETREMFAAAGVELPEPALALLHERTEGWAAGLRLAALSLAGHPDPEVFAEEFSGTERTVADYLLAEVLSQQSPEVRRLLLRTSVLERVNGPLADALTGGSGGERILHDLEEANAFVVSLDAARSWFRYHPMFADLLQLELRRTAPGEVLALHSAAARWYAEHHYPAEAIGHTEAARDWTVAARLLADCWVCLLLNGQGATARELLAGFPARLVGEDAELTAVMAADELARGSLEAAERHLALASPGSAAVPADRRGRFQVLLAVVRLGVAQQRSNLPAAVEQARQLGAMAEAPEAARLGLGEELRGLALINLGITEVWAARFDEAERHLEQAQALAHQIGRPFLEFSGLAHQAEIEIYRSPARAAERSRQAIELARRHGWTDDSAAGTAYRVLGFVLALQGQLDEAEAWIEHAERTVRAEAGSAATVGVHYARGVLELVRGRDAEALAAFRAAKRQGRHLAAPHYLGILAQAMLLHARIRQGETERAERDLAGLDQQDRERGEIHIAIAALRLAQGNPHAAIAALAPVVDGLAPLLRRSWLVQAFLLQAIAREALGDPAAAEWAVERALDLAEPDGELGFFLVHPTPGLLERHARHGTAHASLIARILDLLAGWKPESPPAGPEPPLEPLSDSEIRVLRYLPTHLSGPEIADELYVSANTVKTHLRHLYAKLGTHGRAETVTHARALGLLAPSAQQR
jgi:LuxR family transcriptional regulator, maltose regulon positive regulatory protein